MADQILFDRLNAVNHLVRGGFTGPQAEAITETIDGALRSAVATKHDINELRIATKADIESLCTATKADIGRLDQKIDSAVVRLESKIELVSRDLTIRLGSMIVLLGGILVSIRFFVH
jgi:hypothetical protein